MQPMPKSLVLQGFFGFLGCFFDLLFFATLSEPSGLKLATIFCAQYSTNRLQKQPRLNNAVIVLLRIICYNTIGTSACYFIMEEQNEYIFE